MIKKKVSKICKSIAVIAFAVMLLAVGGCSSPKNVTYLQDAPVGVPQDISRKSNIVARPGDRLSIIVNCSDQKTAAMFALIVPERTTSQMTEDTYPRHQMGYYQVDDNGEIALPVLGKVKVEGLTAPQIADKISSALVDKQYVKDPVVVADFTNLHFSVLGEVVRPGQYAINNNRVTIMEALSQAGDLTIYGRRENVKVIREENGQRMTYLVDLRDSRLYDSPVYYLQQNDVIYVEPNRKRAGDSTVSDNQWLTPGLWISIASFLTTLGVLIFK